jgi:ABC-2 type transport system ATP-binding protein
MERGSAPVSRGGIVTDRSGEAAAESEGQTRNPRGAAPGREVAGTLDSISQGLRGDGRDVTMAETQSSEPNGAVAASEVRLDANAAGMKWPQTRVAIDVRGLRRGYRVARRRSGMWGALRGLLPGDSDEFLAVRDVSFQVHRGELVGVLGPNGAGKSTTVKMLSGILWPDGGEARVLGLVPWRSRRELARRIGVVFGQRTQLWWDLPLRDSLDLLRHVYGVKPDRFAENLAATTDLLDLEAFLHVPVRQLSLGQRMRGDLAAALLHDPEVLFLDEPTIGLDVVAKARIREALRVLVAERGVTVLLTTHDMADVASVCDRILLIDRGQVVHDGPLAGVRAQFGRECSLVVDLSEEVALPSEPLVVPGAREVRARGHRRWLEFDRSVTSASDLVAAVASRYALADLSIEEPSIEEVIARLYAAGRDGRASSS